MNGRRYIDDKLRELFVSNELAGGLFWCTVFRGRRGLRRAKYRALPERTSREVAQQDLDCLAAERSWPEVTEWPEHGVYPTFDVQRSMASV